MRKDSLNRLPYCSQGLRNICPKKGSHRNTGGLSPAQGLASQQQDRAWGVPVPPPAPRLCPLCRAQVVHHQPWGPGEEACHILSQWFAVQFIPAISRDVGAFAGAVSSQEKGERRKNSSRHGCPWNIYKIWWKYFSPDVLSRQMPLRGGGGGAGEEPSQAQDTKLVLLK